MHTTVGQVQKEASKKIGQYDDHWTVCRVVQGLNTSVQHTHTQCEVVTSAVAGAIKPISLTLCYHNVLELYGSSA